MWIARWFVALKHLGSHPYKLFVKRQALSKQYLSRRPSVYHRLSLAEHSKPQTEELKANKQQPLILLGRQQFLIFKDNLRLKCVFVVNNLKRVQLCHLFLTGRWWPHLSCAYSWGQKLAYSLAKYMMFKPVGSTNWQGIFNRTQFCRHIIFTLISEL